MTLLLRRLGTFAVASLAVLVLPLSAAASSPTSEPQPEPVTGNGALRAPAEARTDQLIVIYADGATRTIGSGGRLAGANAVAVDARTDRTVVSLDRTLGGEELDAAVRAAAKLPGVVSAEPDYRKFATALPNDPQLPAQWALTAPSVTSQGIDAAGAWTYTTGSDAARVAIIDSGYTTHADLANRVVSQFDFITNRIVANDGNGRDSNASDPGDWLTATDVRFPPFDRCRARNSSWHGTHVAGIVGANTNNARGVAGVAWRTKFVMARVLGRCGGYDSDTADAIRWSAGLTVSGVPKNPFPARILNLSLGGPGPCASVMQSAVTAAIAAGSTVIVAAGNEEDNVANYSPANCNGVIAVGATNQRGIKPNYSNFGSKVALSAPGGGDDESVDGIMSTLNTGLQSPAGETYVRYSGTSMAAPHVAGVAALVLAANPTLSAAQVRSILVGTTSAFPAGFCATPGRCGKGIVNARRAVLSARATATLPDKPTWGAWTAGFGRVTLRWNAPTSTRLITDYVLQYRVFSSPTWKTLNDGVNTSTNVVVRGLVNYVPYAFRVAAKNSVGTGGFSTSLVAIPTPTRPAPPTGLVATATRRNVALRWTAPDNGGSAIFDYIVQFRNTNSSTWLTLNDGVTATATASMAGLPAGSTYVFRVAAKNAFGVSNYSPQTAPITFRDLPGAPAMNAPTVSSQSVGLSWSSSGDGGSPISDYVVRYRAQSSSTWLTFADGVGVATSTTVTGLTNGVAYVFSVAAKNGVGLSGFSPAGPVTPVGVPAMVSPPLPTLYSVSMGLAWTAPSNGGSPITDYEVQYRQAGTSDWLTYPDGVGTSTTAIVTGLYDGISYEFRVAARNNVGLGEFSFIVTATPRNVPSVPGSLTANGASLSASLNWTTPYDGGNPITGYVVEYRDALSSNWVQYTIAPSSANGVLVSSLAANHSYYFRVSATNAAGTGAAAVTGPVLVFSDIS